MIRRSTLVLVLGLEFARQGTTLAIIDADPNAVIADWAARRVKVGLPVPFTTVSRPKEGEMVATIAELSQSHQVVWVNGPFSF